MVLFQAPGIERLAVRRDGALLRRMITGSGMPEPHAERAFDRLMEPGALSAALNWYRAVPLDRQPPPGPVTVPTTYVWSTGDVALVRSGADLTEQYVSGPYTFEVLDGVSHWIPEEMPVRTAELILARITSAA